MHGFNHKGGGGPTPGGGAQPGGGGGGVLHQRRGCSHVGAPPAALMATLHVSPDDQTVEVSPKPTILDATLGADIPHPPYACGGNARCSTW